MTTSPANKSLVKPSTVRGLKITAGIILTALVAADLFFDGYNWFGIDSSFAFYTWFGLVSAAVLVVLARGAGFLLRRKDNYYDE